MLFQYYSNTLLVDMWSYLRNERLKQTYPVYLQFISNYAHFSKDWCRKLLKNNLEYESILNNSTELSIDWTSREFQIQTIFS